MRKYTREMGFLPHRTFLSRTRALHCAAPACRPLLVAATAAISLLSAAGLSHATATSAGDPRHAPLDFSYRVHGTGPGIGVVFDDGRDVFLQPLNPAQMAALQVIDRSFRVQGPYLVIRGLTDRIEVGMVGSTSGRTIIEYRGRERAVAQEAPGVACTPGLPVEQRVTIPFGTGALLLEPGGLDHLSRMVAMARGARRVTIVSQGERANAPIALRRSARVRELLVAAGIEPGAIAEQVQPPAASSVHVIAVRDAMPCAQDVPAGVAGVPSPAASASVVPAPAAVGTPAFAPPPAPLASPAPIAAPAIAVASGPEPAAAEVPGTRLVFRPDTSVQSTLRSYLKAHRMDVEFRSVPVLMVQEFAQVEGDDVREVLRRALARLGLRGEIQGNRLLVVELAR